MAWERLSSMGALKSCFFLIKKFFYWCIVDLQCCVSFWYIAKWFRYIYIYIYIYTHTCMYVYICIWIYIYIYIYVLFQILFHYRLLQDIEYSSLCYIVGPCCLSLLCTVVVSCFLIVERILTYSTWFKIWECVLMSGCRGTFLLWPQAPTWLSTALWVDLCPHLFPARLPCYLPSWGRWLRQPGEFTWCQPFPPTRLRDSPPPRIPGSALTCMGLCVPASLPRTFFKKK